MKKAAFSLLCASLLAGCAASGPKYNASNLGSIPSDKAQIVMYRPFSLGGGSNPQFVINGNEKCPSLPVNSFLVITAPAGKLSLTEKAFLEQETNFRMNAQAGRRYFVKTQPNSGSNVGVAFGAVGGAIGGAIDGATHPDENNTGRFSFQVMDAAHLANTLSEYNSAGQCGK